MKINLSKRDRKLVMWAGIAVAAYVLLNYWILPQYDSLVEARDKIEVQEHRVTNFRKILGGKSSAQEALAASQLRMANLEAGLLTSGSDALASAEIQGLVKNVVISKSMSFRRSDALPVMALSREYSRVPTRVEIGGTIEQFHDLMKAFMTNPKHLVVEELRVVPSGISPTGNKMIQINLTVSGLRRKEAAPAGTGTKS
jgi:hypothetical protein